MTFRETLLTEARQWEHTSFCWQQSVKGLASDCKAWILESARSAGWPHANEAELMMTGDHRGQVPAGQLRACLARLFDRVMEPEPADLLLLNVAGKPQHLAMYMGNGRMMHCYAKGPSRVIEVPMGNVWWEALDSIWSWRD